MGLVFSTKKQKVTKQDLVFVLDVVNRAIIKILVNSDVTKGVEPNGKKHVVILYVLVNNGVANEEEDL